MLWSNLRPCPEALYESYAPGLQRGEIILSFCLNLLTEHYSLMIPLSSGSVATEKANITQELLREGNTNTKNYLQTVFDILRLVCVQSEAFEVLPASRKD